MQSKNLSNLSSTSSPSASHLSHDEKHELFYELNYLNMGELHVFCRQHKIPFKILVETGDGKTRSTNELDRKGIVIRRIRHYLETGEILPATCFQSNVTSFEPHPDKLTSNDRLYFGQYHKKNKALMHVLAELTNGEFKDGAIARILAREFWTRDEAPTLETFAKAWLRAKANQGAPNPEWAFLRDLSAGRADKNWKKKRQKKAGEVIAILRKIAPPPA